MKLPAYPSLFVSPRAVRELALGHSELAAVAVNAVNGMCVMAMIVMPFFERFTPTLSATLIILFGPLVGFVISSAYFRIDYFVGRMFGGKASRGDVYRIFAWAMLPLAIGFVIIDVVQFYPLHSEKSSLVADGIVTIYAGVVLWKYYAGILSVQLVSRKRMTAIAILSIVSFTGLVYGLNGALNLLIRFGVLGSLSVFL